MLLWQCPHCHVDDALAHKIPWFKPEEVRCTRCTTTWEVQRVIGNDYLLKVTRGAPAILGQERPLAEWYDLMKAGLRLVARQDASVKLPAGEELYVRSREARLSMEADNPLLRRWDEEEAPSEKEGDLGLTFMRKCDRGRLSLTSERFIWAGNRMALTFRLQKVNSVHADLSLFFGMLYGLRLYRFQFDKESSLKWLTYTALVATRVQRAHGDQISLSNY